MEIRQRLGNFIVSELMREKNNNKLQKLNESQGTEGMISVDRIVEHQRGYTSNYLDTLMRGAEYRK